MSQRKIALCNAIIFLSFWLLVLLAGADTPPPPGFIWIIVTVAVCAVVAYWRIPIYIKWYRTRRSGRYWRVTLDGFVAALLVALPFALKGVEEPSVTLQTSDYVTWLFVIGMIGALNSVALYVINALVARRIIRSEQTSRQ